MSPDESTRDENEIRTRKEHRKKVKPLKSTEEVKKKRKRTATDRADDERELKKLNQRDEVEDNIVDSNDDLPTKKAKKPSKRQMKKDKAKQKVAEQRETSKLEAAQKAINYVSKWKHAKSEWKFEKLRQIWLMDHLLDDDLVPDSIFTTVLEYFEGCKGMARQQLVKKMMDVIKKVEEQERKKEGEDEDKDEEENGSTHTAEYQRARKILQALPTDA